MFINEHAGTLKANAGDYYKKVEHLMKKNSRHLRQWDRDILSVNKRLYSCDFHTSTLVVCALCDPPFINATLRGSVAADSTAASSATK